MHRSGPEARGSDSLTVCGYPLWMPRWGQENRAPSWMTKGTFNFWKDTQAPMNTGCLWGVKGDCGETGSVHHITYDTVLNVWLYTCISDTKYFIEKCKKQKKCTCHNISNTHVTHKNKNKKNLKGDIYVPFPFLHSPRWGTAFQMC